MLVTRKIGASFCSAAGLGHDACSARNGESIRVLARVLAVSVGTAHVVLAGESTTAEAVAS